MRILWRASHGLSPSLEAQEVEPGQRTVGDVRMRKMTLRNLLHKFRILLSRCDS